MNWIIYIFVGIIILLVLMYIYKGGYNEGYKDGSKDSLNNIIKFSEMMMGIGKSSTSKEAIKTTVSSPQN